MRPLGPDPAKAGRLIPRSAARRRASGVTRTPPGSAAGPKFRSGVRTALNGSRSRLTITGAAAGGAPVSGCGASSGAAAGAGSVVLADSAEFDASPSARTIATTVPTGTTSPAGTRISAIDPSLVAGTSIVVLSVSISKSTSPDETRSPTAFCQEMIVPSVTVSPSWGIRMSMPRAPLTSRPR